MVSGDLKCILTSWRAVEHLAWWFQHGPNPEHRVMIPVRTRRFSNEEVTYRFLRRWTYCIHQWQEHGSPGSG